MAALTATILRSLVLLLVPLLLHTHAMAQDIVGRVVGITDGDTLTVLTDARRQVTIRLAEIDTPESAQPYGTRARQELSDLVFGKDVRIEMRDTDRYGRTVGLVRAAGLDVNAEMVRRGAAWVYRKYNRDQTLLAVETEARTARRGIWALPEAQRVPPWEWRTAGASEREEARPQVAQASAPPAPRFSPMPVTASPSNTGGFTCGSKRLCREMSSCAEARFHMTQCGLSRLDGDGDGVPCESLCR